LSLETQHAATPDVYSNERPYNSVEPSCPHIEREGKVS
jgi:hypothetical protein